MLKKMVALLAAVLVSMAGAGCGTSGAGSGSAPAASTAVDEYLGMWTQTARGAQQQDQMPRIFINKVGDQYAIADPDGAATKLVGLQTDPDSSGHMTLLAFEIGTSTLATREGDHLTLSHSGHTFTVTAKGDTMTWTESDSVYHFIRVTSS